MLRSHSRTHKGGGLSHTPGITHRPEFTIEDSARAGPACLCLLFLGSEAYMTMWLPVAVLGC